MTTVPVTLQVPQEIQILGDALDALIAGIIAKKSFTVVVTEALPAVMSALSTVGEIPADLKSSPDARAYLAVVLERAIDSLLAPAPAAAPAAPVA